MSVTQKVDKFNKKYGPLLESGELVIAYSDPFVLLTNARLIQLQMNGKFEEFFPLSEVSKLDREESTFSASLVIFRHDGTKAAIAAGFRGSEWDDFQNIFRDAVANLDANLLSSAKPTETQTYGSISAQGFFGTKYVTVYSKGFVKVSSGMGMIKGQIEQLLDIFGETDVNKKTGLGRAAGAVFTMGANLALSPNQRGNLYLTIATDRQTHSLFWDRPDAASIKVMNQLVSAGKAAIAIRTNGSQAGQSSHSQATTLEVQLQHLADMHSKGLLDEAEFKASKAKLLGL